MLITAQPGLQRAAVSSALANIFRGKFCDTLLRDRAFVSAAKGTVIYDVGDRARTFFFLRRGVVKVGAVTDDGREVIYDLRKDGDLAGELCVCDTPRRDRAVALEPTDVTEVPYEEILDNLQQNRDGLEEILGAICRALSSAYDQASLLSSGGTLDRLVKVLLRLARQFGRPAGDLIEVETYLTQEEISQMMASSREKVSMALNLLRDRGMVQYSRGGHLLLDVPALERGR
jgi:CRP/FNR family transcriptional regulator, cyclic AMP receptor protein